MPGKPSFVAMSLALVLAPCLVLAAPPAPLDPATTSTSAAAGAEPAVADPEELATGEKPGIEQERLRAFMRSRHEQVGLCAARARASHPDLAGKVTMKFGVAGDGRVTSAEVTHSEADDETFHGCLKATAFTWTLPPPNGGPTDVGYTFVLRLASGPASNGWRVHGKRVNEASKYPGLPALGPHRPVAPPRVPGTIAVSYGWTMFATGYIVGGTLGVVADAPQAFVPLIGPFLTGGADVSPGLMAALGLLQFIGGGVAAAGHARVARHRKTQRRETAWRRHQMQAAFSPSSAAGRSSQFTFRMRF